MVSHEWSDQQLTRFASADDFQVSPFYSDGKTYGTPTWIWSVVVKNNLYIRAWNGEVSRWHRSAVQQGAGRISLAGNHYKVQFIPLANEQINAAIDRAYQKKYAGSAYLNPMIQAGPRSSTLQVIPR